MKCVVLSVKTVAQGTSQMVPLSGTHGAIPLGWNATPGLFLAKPFGQRLLWAVAGVGHEDKGLQARAPRPRLAQRPKSISATRFSTFKTASKRGHAPHDNKPEPASEA